MRIIWLSAGFPRGIESNEKVLNFKIGFQDLEKVLNFAKMYIRYWKSMDLLNGKEISSIWAEFYWRQSTSFLCSVMQCVKLSFMIKNFEKCREAVVLNFLNLVLKKYGKWFIKMRGNPVSAICHMRPVEGFHQLQFAETPFSAGNSNRTV